MKQTLIRFGSLGILPLLALAFALEVRGDDWPQWRGPNRDAKATGFNVPSEWPKSLTKKWKTSVGEGVASASLAGDKLYVFTRQGGNEVISCLDAGTGKEVWQDKYPAESVNRPAQDFQGPRSTPAVGEGKVCTLGVGGTVSCLDAATGKIVWRKETKSKPRFSTSSSPIIVDGKCIAHVGSQGAGKLTAYDLASGEEKWKCKDDGPSYASPVLATIQDTKQVVVLTDKNLAGVALADGKLLWQTPLKGQYNSGTPVVDGDMVICMGSAFKIEKKDDAFTAAKLWKDQSPHIYNTPVLKDGLLFGMMGRDRDSSKLFCQDAKTGAVLWTDKTSRGGCGEVVDAGSVLLALSSDSDLLVFKPSKTGYEEVAKYHVADSPTWGYPVIAGNRIFVKDKDSITLWTIE